MTVSKRNSPSNTPVTTKQVQPHSNQAMEQAQAYTNPHHEDSEEEDADDAISQFLNSEASAHQTNQPAQSSSVFNNRSAQQQNPSSSAENQVTSNSESHEDSHDRVRRSQFRFNAERNLTLLKEVFIFKPYSAEHGDGGTKWMEVAENVTTKDEAYAANDPMCAVLKFGSARSRFNTMVESYKKSLIEPDYQTGFEAAHLTLLESIINEMEIAEKKEKAVKRKDSVAGSDEKIEGPVSTKKSKTSTEPETVKRQVIPTMSSPIMSPPVQSTQLVHPQHPQMQQQQQAPHPQMIRAMTAAEYQMNCQKMALENEAKRLAIEAQRVENEKSMLKSMNEMIHQDKKLHDQGMKNMLQMQVQMCETLKEIVQQLKK